MSKISVIKRNGSTQEFDKEKVARVCVGAGLSEKAAKKLASKVESWLKASGRSPVTTLEIRDKVIEELERTDPKVAHFFIWYQKMKDKGSLDGKIS